MVDQLTCHDRGHEGGEHEEEHAEEEEAGVVQPFTGLVADSQVQQADQDPHRQVRNQPQAGQRLINKQYTSTCTIQILICGIVLRARLLTVS